VVRIHLLIIVLVLVLVVFCNGQFYEGDTELDTLALADLSDESLELLKPRFEQEHARRSAQMVEHRAAVEKLKVEIMEYNLNTEEKLKKMSSSVVEAKQLTSEVGNVQKQVEEMETELKNIRTNIDDLEVEVASAKQRLAELEIEKQSTEKRVEEPSLTDVLDASSSHWGATSRNIYQKAFKEVVPAMESIRSTANQYQLQVTRSSRFVALAASLLMYTFILSFCYGVYKTFRRVKGRFTLARVLFLGDLFCTLFWAIVLILYLIMFTDPMVVMQKRMPVIFFIFQLMVMVSYVSYVFLRVILFADELTWPNLGELLSVIVVGHHYYLRVWQPAISDAFEVKRTVWIYYVCYGWMFGAFMYNRVQAFAPLKQLRGNKLPVTTWFRILNKHFWEDKTEGDLETTSIYSSASSSE